MQCGAVRGIRAAKVVVDKIVFLSYDEFVQILCRCIGTTEIRGCTGFDGFIEDGEAIRGP